MIFPLSWPPLAGQPLCSHVLYFWCMTLLAPATGWCMSSCILESFTNQVVHRCTSSLTSNLLALASCDATELPCLCRSRAAQLRGRVSNNSSRPASLHVDDFEKAASLATPPTLNLALKATGFTQPSPAGLSSLRSGSLTPRETVTPTAGSLPGSARASATAPVAAAAIALTPGLLTAAAPPAAVSAPDVASPKAAVQPSMLNRAVKPEIKQDSSLLLPSSSGVTAGFRSESPAATAAQPVATSAFVPQESTAMASTQPGSATQLLLSSAAAAERSAQPTSSGQELSSTAGHPTPAVPNVQLPVNNALASEPMEPMQVTAAELIEVDPFEDMVIEAPAAAVTAAALQSRSSDHRMAQTGHGPVPSMSAEAQQPLTGVQQPSASAQALQPPNVAVEEDAVDLYSDFGPEPSVQPPSQPSTSQPQPHSVTASLAQTSSGPQQSPSPSPELLRRSSSASQASAAQAAGLSHRDPRRSSGPRTNMTQPNKPAAGVAGNRDPRQALAAAEAQLPRPAQAMSSAGLPAAGPSQAARQPAQAGDMTPADELPRQTSSGSAGAGAVRQGSGAAAGPAAAVRQTSSASAGASAAPRPTAAAARGQPSVAAAPAGSLSTTPDLPT